MSRLIAFDPALRTTGVAVFDDEVLVDAYALRVPGSGRGPAEWGRVAAAVWDSLPLGQPQVVVLEAQVVYPHAKADPNDILQVSGVAGGLAALAAAGGATLAQFDPAAWKGQVPKQVMAERSRSLLSPTERVCVRPKSTLDTWDAIGIGLHHLQRRTKWTSAQPIE